MFVRTAINPRGLATAIKVKRSWHLVHTAKPRGFRKHHANP
jgi:hypothetical protein